MEVPIIMLIFASNLKITTKTTEIMKARIRETGEVIELGYSGTGSSVRVNEAPRYRQLEDSQLEFNLGKIDTTLDWNSFRLTTSAKILCSLLSSENGIGGNSEVSRVCVDAIVLADELIKKLKQSKA